ncbi:CD1375 family protein [Paenibacillus wenxiniae]|uniref:CD1375 family protein n=1 Tax=Paenibacillus wenxiniae TaxID=1636843 RepID=A0ABW4RI25_9BACL
MKMKFAEAYWVLVQAGRRTEDSVPEELRVEYEMLKQKNDSGVSSEM